MRDLNKESASESIDFRSLSELNEALAEPETPESFMRQRPADFHVSPRALHGRLQRFANAALYSGAIERGSTIRLTCEPEYSKTYPKLLLGWSWRFDVEERDAG
ncbi:MAG: hypothetical protein F4X64_00235 [Chloroflexi bacterium]|nr:hypothetical protein [Chloroflexota bacterium]